MPERDVFRKESKRWVAPKTSYDGDDWGNDEFDEYEEDEILDEPEEERLSTMQFPQHTNSSQRGASDLKTVTEETPNVETDAHAPAPSIEKTAETTAASQPSSGHRTSTLENQTSSIQDDKTVRGTDDDSDKKNHKLDEQVRKEVPESSATKTPVTHLTGDPSIDDDAKSAADRSDTTAEEGERGNFAQGGEQDYQEEDVDDDDDGSSIQDIYGFYESRYSSHPYNAVLRSSSGGGTGNEFSDSSASLSTGAYSVESSAFDARRNSDIRASQDYQRELNRVPEASGETHSSSSNATELWPKVSHLHIRKAHSRDSSIDTQKETPVVNKEVSSSPERPYSQDLDPDIAELYEGTSKFLNRPISTYNHSIPHDFSDQSVKKLLTPHLEQERFETPPANPEEAEERIPSLLVTSASPEPVLHSNIAASLAGTEDKPKSESVGASNNAFETDHAYVDKVVSHDSGGDSDADADSDGGEGDQESSLSGRGKSTEGEAENESDSADAEPFILPSERKRIQAAPIVAANTDGASTGYDNESSLDPAQERGHTPKLSETSGASIATGVTSDSSPPGSLMESRASESVASHGRSPEGSVGSAFDVSAKPGANSETKEAETQDQTTAPRAPQPITAKVKRPPNVDFSALLNNSGSSSESRCEQMRILRAREAEYSSGLETWLLATMSQVDKNMKLYTNGIPPVADANSLELPTTAKVSNAMHSSATNTKEKLGKVGEKSKSFFAKVIR